VITLSKEQATKKRILDLATEGKLHRFRLEMRNYFGEIYSTKFHPTKDLFEKGKALEDFTDDNYAEGFNTIESLELHR